MEKNSFKIKLVVIMLLTITISSFLTFGFFYAGKSQSGESGMATLSCFDMSFSDKDSISLDKAYPITDEEGLKSTPYTFTIKNNCSEASNYYVILNIKTGSFSENYLNLAFDDSSSVKRISTFTANSQFATEIGYDRSYIISRGTLGDGKEKTHSIKIWLDKDTTYDSVKGKTFEAQVKVVSVVGELDNFVNPGPAEIVLAKLGKKAKSSSSINFFSAATTDETKDGLYAMEDDYGTSYFYRGNVTDNYVKFDYWDESTPDVYYGQYSETDTRIREYTSLSECQRASSYNYNCTQVSRAGKPMYWRIIRVNGDGSVRLLYDGTEPHQNGDNSLDRIAWASQAFNTLYDDAKYVGYMYGPENATVGTTTASTSKEIAQTNTVSSDIKTALENWYVTNIKNKNLDEFIADSVFCYDRSTPGKDLTGWTYDTGLGYGTNITAYGAYARLGTYNNVQPQFTCSNKNDAYTKSDTTKGNGVLSEKIGLISADEVVTGGSRSYNYHDGNQSYYLYKSSEYWSGSPFSSSSDAYVIVVGNYGNLDFYSVNNAIGVAPVINLTPEYFSTFGGDGTIGNEFYSVMEWLG